MKQILVLAYSLVMGSTAFAIRDKNISDKIQSLFRESFPNAQGVSWTETPETYIVNFVDDNVRTNIVYEKTGAFVRSTRYYQEQTLPYYLRVAFRKKYPEKKIFGIIETASALGVEYFVKLEDSKVVTTIKIESDGSLEMVEKYEKATP